METDTHAQAQALLERIAGPGAVFRESQWEAIDTLVSRRGKALVVQRTGWGKSAVYIIATRLLRTAGFLHRTAIPIEARKRWPAAVEGPDLNATPLDDGLALSYWGDPGFGELVRLGKYRDGRFAPGLVEAMRKMIVEWAPDPAPQSVTYVPSHRHPQLVSGFAAALAEILTLPLIHALTVRSERPEQKEMANSIQQARNAAAGFSVAQPLDDVGLLVDDIVDSRWTLTVTAARLKEAGATHVYPVALADAARG